jgi:hypothetical protein
MHFGVLYNSGGGETACIELCADVTNTATINIYPSASPPPSVGLSQGTFFGRSPDLLALASANVALVRVSFTASESGCMLRYSDGRSTQLAPVVGPGAAFGTTFRFPLGPSGTNYRLLVGNRDPGSTATVGVRFAPTAPVTNISVGPLLAGTIDLSAIAPTPDRYVRVTSNIAVCAFLEIRDASGAKLVSLWPS